MELKSIMKCTPDGTPWELDFLLKDGENGSLLEVHSGDTLVLAVSRDEMLRVAITTQWKKNERENAQTLTFRLTSPKRAGLARIVWRDYSFRLYVDGKLVDEEWPLGEPAYGEWDLLASDVVSDLTYTAAKPCEEEEETTFTGSFQNYTVPGHNTYAGDCMPFARDGRYCVYYLFDRRRHESKNRLGAHQWAQISSADLKSWTVHPMAVGITQQWEGSICTGSLIQKDGVTYAFYAVRMSDWSPAGLTWATSPDGVHFEKSGKYFSLTEPYEPVSARDPKVFLGADGQYHMLVTTSLKADRRFGGCLAHLTSNDLETWTQQDPFLVPGYVNQPECPDYFEWNGWYYLTFNCVAAHYRMSRSPFGPWIRPAYDLLDSREVRVPKTAPYGDRRLCTGYLRLDPRLWAGTIVTHELFQRPDGTLGIKQLEEILPPVKNQACLDDIALKADQNRAAALLPTQGTDFRLRAVLEIGEENALAGIILTLGQNGDGKRYRIEMDPAAGTVVVIHPGEDVGLGRGRDILTQMHLSGQIQIDMVVIGNMVDLLFSDGRGITVPIVRPADTGLQVEFYAFWGTLDVRQIRLETY